MELDYILKDDYDQKFKVNKSDIFCYSKSQLDDIYPEHNYYVVGEITGKKYNVEKGSANKFILKDDAYALYERGKKSQLLYRRAGYICVGDDKFVGVLKSRIPFLIIFLILLAGIVISSSVLFSNMSTEPQEVALNPLPELDPYAESIENLDGGIATAKSLEPESQNNGGGKVSMAYTLKANLNLETSKIAMMFQNPKESNQGVMIELYIESGNEQVLIAQSKLISAGYGISNLDYIANQVVLSQGTYKGFYIVKYYNESTGEKALVETQIDDVDITIN